MVSEKRCPRCQQHKPAEAFNKNARRSSGLSDYCRDCMRDVLKAYRAANRERLLQEGRERARKRYEVDPAAGAAKSKVWRERNPDKVKAIKRRAYEKRQPQALAYARHYRQGRPEERKRLWRRWWQRNAEQYRAKRKQQYADDPAREIARVERRRARKLAAEGQYSTEQWHALVTFYCPTGCCLACGEQRSLTVDHVVPLDNGGTNWPDNLQPLCVSCNSSKGTRTTDYRHDQGAFARTLTKEAPCGN